MSNYSQRYIIIWKSLHIIKIQSQEWLETIQETIFILLTPVLTQSFKTSGVKDFDKQSREYRLQLPITHILSQCMNKYYLIYYKPLKIGSQLLLSSNS